jgi:hypothetical protein
MADANHSCGNGDLVRPEYRDGRLFSLATVSAFAAPSAVYCTRRAAESGAITRAETWAKPDPLHQDS